MVVLTFHDFSMALEYGSYVDIVYHDTIIVYPNKVFNSVLFVFSYSCWQESVTNKAFYLVLTVYQPRR